MAEENDYICGIVRQILDASMRGKKRVSPRVYYMHITSHAPYELWRLLEPYV